MMDKEHNDNGKDTTIKRKQAKTATTVTTRMWDKDKDNE